MVGVETKKKLSHPCNLESPRSGKPLPLPNSLVEATSRIKLASHQCSDISGHETSAKLIDGAAPNLSQIKRSPRIATMASRSEPRRPESKMEIDPVDRDLITSLIDQEEPKWIVMQADWWEPGCWSEAGIEGTWWRARCVLDKCMSGWWSKWRLLMDRFNL